MQGLEKKIKGLIFGAIGRWCDGSIDTSPSVLSFSFPSSSSGRMKVLIQRVLEASVNVDGKTISSIGKGLLLFVCVMKGDTQTQAEYLAKKCAELRVFENEEGKFHFSALDLGHEMLVVSQFTLAADGKKGRRPSFEQAEEPEKAKALCDVFCAELRKLGVHVAEGIFGADMKVALTNDGPVTLVVEG